MFAFGNLQMENLQNQNASPTGTTLTSTNAPTSNTNPTSTTAGSTTDSKGKQLQVPASRKRNVDDKKSHKFGIILQNLMVILQPLELNVIIVERIMHVILLLMVQVICGVI
jgi:hypothetical protein